MKPSQVKHVTVSNFTCYYLCQIVVWSPSKTTVHCIGRHSPGFYYVTYVHNAYVGILAENIRSSFCVVKFYAIKKACELVGIKFLLISNSFYLTWVPPVGNCIHICHLCIWISRGSIQNAWVCVDIQKRNIQWRAH